jgi:hypothetical protein
MRKLTVSGQVYNFRVLHLDSEGTVLSDKPLYATNPAKGHRNFRQQLWNDDVLTGDQLVLLTRKNESSAWEQVEMLAVEAGNDAEYFADMESGADFERQDFATAS